MIIKVATRVFLPDVLNNGRKSYRKTVTCVPVSCSVFFNCSRIFRCVPRDRAVLYKYSLCLTCYRFFSMLCPGDSCFPFPAAEALIRLFLMREKCFLSAAVSFVSSRFLTCEATIAITSVPSQSANEVNKGISALLCLH